MLTYTSTQARANISVVLDAAVNGKPVSIFEK
jgi:antitoxin (DNA-binding transcriptional repressor) of toxin-antitoxin stability system